MHLEQLLLEIAHWRARAYRAEAERDDANVRAAREKRRADEAERMNSPDMNGAEPKDETQPIAA